MNLVMHRISVPTPSVLTTLRLWLVAGVLLGGAAIARADIIHVSADGTGDYPTLQAAIDNAPVGSTIQVDPGTYRESLVWSDKDLTIQGAGAGQTIIDPSTASNGPGGRCLYTSFLTVASHIDGFTLQRGQAPGDSGGGMYNYLSGPTISNCTFSGNTATIYGGGIYNYLSSPIITACAFTANYADGSGGGIYNDTNCYPTITNCTFSGNSTNGSGGGMFNWYRGNPTLTNCTFSGNSATYNGGGMYNAYSSPTVTNSTFAGNLAGQAGRGGGMFNDANCSPTLTNCILWSNVAPFGGAGIYNYDSTSTPTLSHTDSQDFANVTPDASGNFKADPRFVRNPFTNAPDDYGDLHLQSGSPGINVGDNSAVPADVTTDLDGSPRIVGANVDLGAYESTVLTILDTTPPTLNWGTPTPAPNAAGWNNGAVDIAFTTADDLSGVASATPGSPLHFDVEGAGQTQKVTVTDNANNTAQFTSPAVNIDWTAPTTSASVSGSTTSTVTLSASDNLSRVKATYYRVDGGAPQTYIAPFTLAKGQHTVQYWSVDNADNVETANTLTYAVTLTVANASGKRGGKVNLSATLTQSSNSAKLSGKTITFRVDGAAVGNATTDKKGVASLSYTIPSNATISAHPVTASFGGDLSTYQSAQGAATLTVTR